MELNFNIFISHDSKDETIAFELKEFLENIFLNSNVYVSGRDLEGGQTWIENIKITLKSSQVIISIISNESLKNQWLFFETGAGFIEDKSIPLITDGLKFSDLKPPLSLLQARMLSDSGIKLLVNDISKKTGSRAPIHLIGIENFMNKCEKFILLRNSDKVIKNPPIVNVINEIKLSNPVHNSNVDPEIIVKRNDTELRAKKLTIKKLLSFSKQRSFNDFPSENELLQFDINKLLEISKAYSVPYPANAFTNLLFLNIMTLPSKDAREWEKFNVLKRIEDANIDLEKYENTF